MKTLSIHDHDRTGTGYSYVYPVISRRAGGVSVGINLNPNNACNWACIYCQVPGLTRGDAPTIDLVRLESELREFLGVLVHGDWMAKNVPAGFQVLRDIAFSGNGEPTSAREFPQTVDLVRQVLKSFGLLHEIKVRLITNGSLMQREPVLDAVSALAAINGEVWFKIDRASRDGMSAINGVTGNIAGVKRRLLACSARCQTWIQTCWFAVDGKAPSTEEFARYLALLDEVRTVIAGVQLYGLARQPMQPGAERLSPLPPRALEDCACSIRQLGIAVNVAP